MSAKSKTILKNIAFIVLINLIVLIALEGLTRIFIRSPIELFEETEDAEGKIWVHYRYGPLQPKFLKQKEKDTFRIFSLGGSTTMGFPYHPRSSFPKMLELGLKQMTKTEKIEVINLGVLGMNSLDIKYRVLQALRYSPDLMVIYTGQNEFFCASLISDFKYPRLDKILTFFRIHSRLYQSLTIFDRIATLFPAAIGANQELAEKFNLDFVQLPIEKRPMTKEFYQGRVKGFRYHLEQILSILKKKNVPVILCTVAVNLRDWPPEWMPYPDGLSDSEINLLKQNLYTAYLYIADDRLDEAERLINQVEPLSKNYAMFYFVKAWLLEKKGEFESAKSYFLLARKFDNCRHRAPPEINQVIRELAKEYQANLIDVENLFSKNAKTTPGFDLFTDHVHPNLFGQRFIAENIYHSLLENNFLKINEPSPQFLSLNELKNDLQLDENFLSDINLRMTIYYLLQKRLPEKNKMTIELLKEVIQNRGEGILPRILLASLFLSQNQTPEAISTLKECFTLDRMEIQQTLERYLFPNIVMQRNFLLFHLNLELTEPLFRGIILVRDDPQLTRLKPILPVNQYNWIFKYIPEKNEIVDVSDQVRDLYKNHQSACKENRFQTLNIKNYFLANPKSFYANQTILSSKSGKMELNMFGNDPFIIFPVKLDPLFVNSIILELSVKPDDAKQKQTELNLYWSSEEKPIFKEDKKISIPLKANAKTQSLLIDLGKNINWLSSDEVLFLRIDPATFPGKTFISTFKINLCAQSYSPDSP